MGICTLKRIASTAQDIWQSPVVAIKFPLVRRLEGLFHYLRFPSQKFVERVQLDTITLRFLLSGMYMHPFHEGYSEPFGCFVDAR